MSPVGTTDPETGVTEAAREIAEPCVVVVGESWSRVVVGSKATLVQLEIKLTGVEGPKASGEIVSGSRRVDAKRVYLWKDIRVGNRAIWNRRDPRYVGEHAQHIVGSDRDVVKDARLLSRQSIQRIVGLALTAVLLINQSHDPGHCGSGS